MPSQKAKKERKRLDDACSIPAKTLNPNQRDYLKLEAKLSFGREQASLARSKQKSLATQECCVGSLSKLEWEQIREDRNRLEMYRRHPEMKAMEAMQDNWVQFALK